MNWIQMNRIRMPIFSTDNDWLIDLSPIKIQIGIAVGTTDDYLKACLESRPHRFTYFTKGRIYLSKLLSYLSYYVFIVFLLNVIGSWYSYWWLLTSVPWLRKTENIRKWISSLKSVKNMFCFYYVWSNMYKKK